MPKRRSKRYTEAAKLVEPEKLYLLSEAIEILKKMPTPKFDPTVALTFKLGVDPKQSTQMVRGSAPLPHGLGKKVRVIVFATGDAAKAAESAGADEVGMADLLKKVTDGWMEFDSVIATPDAMSEVRKLGRVLGPHGLMPNPKLGTVTNDTATAVTAVKAGRAEYKLDRGGSMACAIGKASFTAQAIEENATAVIETVMKSKPAAAKGNFIRSLTLTATMSPGLHIDPKNYNN